jgi:hypothetical protein
VVVHLLVVHRQSSVVVYWSSVHMAYVLEQAEHDVVCQSCGHCNDQQRCNCSCLAWVLAAALEEVRANSADAKACC